MIEKLDSSPDAVRRTGKAFLIGGTVIGGLLLLSQSHVSGWSDWDLTSGFAHAGWKWVFGIGIVLFILSRVAYPVMKPIHIVWMTIAFVLGWVNTRLLLGLFFYLIITPIGVIMRAFGKDFLQEKIARSATTYWIKRETGPLERKRYENLF